MTLINTFSYEATPIRRERAARRLAVMPLPAGRPHDRRLPDRLLFEEARQFRADRDTHRTEATDLFGVPSRDVLEMAVAVSGAMTVSRQAARSIMLLAGG
jgi:hypothetical protein